MVPVVGKILDFIGGLAGPPGSRRRLNLPFEPDATSEERFATFLLACYGLGTYGVKDEAGRPSPRKALERAQAYVQFVEKNPSDLAFAQQLLQTELDRFPRSEGGDARCRFIGNARDITVAGYSKTHADGGFLVMVTTKEMWWGRCDEIPRLEDARRIAASPQEADPTGHSEAIEKILRTCFAHQLRPRVI